MEGLKKPMPRRCGITPRRDQKEASPLVEQSLPETRIARALKLQQEQGDTFERIGPHLWIVGDYRVDLSRRGQDEYCDCPDYYYRHERDRSSGLDLETAPCKHGLAAEIETAKRRARRRRGEAA
jgi:hypothetical protein